MFSEDLFSSWLLGPMHLVAGMLWKQNCVEDSLFLRGQKENKSMVTERDQEQGTRRNPFPVTCFFQLSLAY